MAFSVKGGFPFDMIKSIFLIISSMFLLFLYESHAIADGEIATLKEKATIAADHCYFMRQAFDLAIDAGKHGNHTFGALLVYQNKVILTSENTVYTDRNVHSHAEINLMTKAKLEIPPEVLRECIMYVSTAPCMLCCASIWYRGIKRLVYGVSYETFAKLTGCEDKSIPCDKLYRETGKPLEWIGPVLEEEGLRVFYYWPQDSFRRSLLEKLHELGIETPQNVRTELPPSTKDK